MIGISTKERTLNRKTKVDIKKRKRSNNVCPQSRSVVFVSKCPRGKTKSGGERSRLPQGPLRRAWSMVAAVVWAVVVAVVVAAAAAAAAAVRVCCDDLETLPF